jgi:uncharacterized protein (TIGR00297 family)
MTLHVLLGFVVAAAIALAARRMRSLTSSGAVTATAIGTIAVAAGWSWGILLVIYFVAATSLSRLGRAEKELRIASIVAKGGERDAVQVLANGLVFASAAIAMLLHPSTYWFALGAGSLAASAADTWATEIGTLYGKRPRSILTGRLVPPGTSGGVSIAGTAATIAGAAFIASVVILSATPALMRSGGPALMRSGGKDLFWPIVAGGIAGSLIDSILGATVQSRRRCDVCACDTERPIHDCGNATRAIRGIGWLDNDMVNFVSAIAGGLLAATLVR